MFYGEFDYKIDEKGRLPVPPKFRDALKEGVVLTQGAESCITVYTVPAWKKLSEKLTNSPLSRSKIRKLSRALFSSAFSNRIDQQGRIAIPVQLREHAQIVDDAVVVGMNTYLEIWSKVLWQEEKTVSQQQAWQIIETLETNEQ